MEKRYHFFTLGIVLSSVLALGCDRTQAIEDVPEGTDVVVRTEDGRLVRGRLATVDQDTVVVTGERNAAHTRIARAGIASVRSGEDVKKEPEARLITVPAHTTLELTLDTPVASNAAQVEDVIEATLTSPLVVDGITVAPDGSLLTGIVTQAKESGKVKGRAELGLRFDRLRVGTVTYDVSAPVHFMASASKAKDAGKIGIGAAAGALIGGIAGGGKGAAIGSAVGAGGGTAVVLATGGEDIQLNAGRHLQVELAESLTVAMPPDGAAAHAALD